MTSNLNDPRSLDPAWTERILLSDGYSVTGESLELVRLCIVYLASRGVPPPTLPRGTHRSITIARVQA